MNDVSSVRSGQVWGHYAEAARSRVHLATVLLRPPSGHRPGRRQARHARILQTGAKNQGKILPPGHRLGNQKTPFLVLLESTSITSTDHTHGHWLLFTSAG